MEAVEIVQKHRITVAYCAGCRWMLRAAWMAQELLSTFESHVASVALCPIDGGRFIITVDEHVIWDRHRDGGFPEIKQLKSLVRDQIDPGRPLGHIDRASSSASPEQPPTT